MGNFAFSLLLLLAAAILWLFGYVQHHLHWFCFDAVTQMKTENEPFSARGNEILLINHPIILYSWWATLHHQSYHTNHYFVIAVQQLVDSVVGGISRYLWHLWLHDVCGELDIDDNSFHLFLSRNFFLVNKAQLFQIRCCSNVQRAVNMSQPQSPSSWITSNNDHINVAYGISHSHLNVYFPERLMCFVVCGFRSI